MKISRAEIQKLRGQTGVGIMDCKKALTDAKGDFKCACEIIKKTGAMKAAKKASCQMNSGIISSYIHDGKIGVMVKLGCETDFVAKNPEFNQLAYDLAMQVASMNPKDKKELLAQNYIKDQDITIKELIEQKILKIGENIQVISFVRESLEK